MSFIKNSDIFMEFLQKYKKTEEQTTYTHTRIGDKNLKIYGGSYNLPNEFQTEFLDRYYDKVFEKGQMEYITEKQLIEDGPILLDIDLRYENSIKEKQHTENHIIDFIMLYAEKIKNVVNIDKNSEIDVYVMEKNNVNVLENCTKDGIHIIIGIKMHKALQCIIRDMVLQEIPNIWEDLNIKNTWDDVIDEGVVKGFVNWQLYGSRKPKHEAYLIKYQYKLSIDGNNNWDIDCIWNVNNQKNNKIASNGVETHKMFNTKANLYKLSARYDKHPSFPMKDEYKEIFEKQLSQIHTKNKVKNENSKNKNKLRLKIVNHKHKNKLLSDIDYSAIQTMEVLDSMIEELFTNMNPTFYRLKEVHSYTLALPKSFYGQGSYNKWIRVGWALANTHHNLFLTWLKMSTKGSEDGSFDWESVPKMYDMWCNFDLDNPEGLTARSIMYWCKNENPKEYYKIRTETIDYYIDQTIQSATEFDLATVLYHLYKDNFVCVSISRNIWYEYREHRWREIDSGNTLRLYISREMHQEYINRVQELTEKLHIMDQSSDMYEKIRNKSIRLAEISVYLKKTNWKNNIMREAKELFYDREFMDKLDQNPYLMCFNNCVIDFKEKKMRKGQPEDYISKSTNIDYIPFYKIKNDKAIQEINKFMDELFPNQDLRKYMWEHLASILIGTTVNQTFNVYIGSGRNGKSCLVDLMSKTLGEYKGTVPITLITQKRNSIGSTSSEIVQLMGIRYAVMQEPSRGDRVNEGILKEITAGDPIQGRALFKDTITFVPQFKLVVCTNTELELNSTDDGTLRRFRIVDFQSKFLEEPYSDEIKFPRSQCPYQYKLDKNLSSKFSKWAPVLMSMLVEKAFEKQGHVTDYNVVMASTDKYRESQDYLAQFIKEKIIHKEGAKIKKSEIYNCFKEWMSGSFGSSRPKNIPKAREIHEYMNTRFGHYNKGWHNVMILYEDDDDEEVIEDM